MLSRMQRLDREQFGKVLTRNVAIRGVYLSLKIMNMEKRSASSVSRFSVVVSKKVALSAVARNRIRRRCYGVLQELLPHIISAYKGIFFVRISITHLSYAMLKKEMRMLLERSGAVQID